MKISTLIQTLTLTQPMVVKTGEIFYLEFKENIDYKHICNQCKKTNYLTKKIEKKQ